jgi:hypothetical protein
MANGYCPALLRTIESVAGENAPSRKLHVAGFLQMAFCCQNSSVSVLNDQYPGDGTNRPLTVSYRQRPVLSQVQDEDDCDINNLPVKLEWAFPNRRHKQTSFFIPDSQIAQYCSEYSQTVQIGRPATTLMREHYDNFLEAANILLRAINVDVVTLMATQFGNNSITGSAAARTINIPQTAGLNLGAGVIQLFRDFQENELCGDPCIVGGGNFAGFTISQLMACCNAAGQDTSRVGLPAFYFDKDSQTIWGANQIGVFAKGSVKFIGYNKYAGNYAGEKGGSIFFTVALPVNEFGCAPDCLNDLVFDVQMKYIDCPTSITVNGTAQTVNRGWQVIVSKEYHLWVQPTDAYRIGDPLAGTNGTLRYTITNTA